MPTKHRKYGGSSAQRTNKCAVWRAIAATMPEVIGDGANPFADRGTLLHNATEKFLDGSVLDLADCIGMKYNDQTLDEEMYMEALEPMIDTYEAFAEDNKIDGELFEVEVVTCEDVGGTADLIATNADTVFSIDWKYGHNLVDPYENDQGLFYVMSAMESQATAHLFEGRDKIVIGIGQPAGVTQGEDILRTWETTKERIAQFYDQHMDAIDLSDKLIACTTVEEAIAMSPPCAGSWCQYCKAAPVCPAKTGLARKARTLDASSSEAKVLGEALGMVTELEQWCKQVRASAHEQAEQGLKIEGFKLVAKRASRKWTDHDAVMEMVRKARLLKIEEATDSKLKSVAQLEKVCKAKKIDFKKYSVYSESVSSGTSLVLESDKRPEVPAINALAEALAQLGN
jgi:hypothetical protein